MKLNTTYEYDNGKSTCTMTYKGINFSGEAKCHPDDMDYGGERTGMSIAEARANIKVLCFIRDHEIKNQLKILNHLYCNIQNSKYYNEKSHESSMLRNQIAAIEAELAAIKNAIADERKFLKDYINGKDELYKKLRAKSH